MREKPRRRLTDKDLSGASYIDTDTTLSGNMSCNGDVVVAGAVKGEIRATGSVTLSADGRWEGLIEAADAVIAGQIQGSVAVAGKLEVRRSARIRGTLRAGTIAVAEGAVIDGDMTCTNQPGVIRYEEKRKEDRKSEVKLKAQ